MSKRCPAVLLTKTRRGGGGGGGGQAVPHGQVGLCEAFLICDFVCKQNKLILKTECVNLLQICQKT